MDRVVFRVGMVVIVHHGLNDNNAIQIEYQDNLQGPIAAKNSNTLTVLGQNRRCERRRLRQIQPERNCGGQRVRGFRRPDPRDLHRTEYPIPHHGGEIEVKGFVSSLSSSGFRLGPLPDGTGMAVTVSYTQAAGAGLADGMYVQVVTTDPQPVSGVITATQINKLTRGRSFRRMPWPTSKDWSPFPRAVPGTFSPSPWRGSVCRRTAPRNTSEARQ